MKLTTGVISRDPSSFNAHIHICNLDKSAKIKASVEVFDWGVDQMWDAPAPVSVIPSGTVSLGPHTHHSFISLINQSTAQPSLLLGHYEVRITVSSLKNVVINCYAVDSFGKLVPGNTVNHKELVELV
jgi:hypothetical protein